LDKELIEEGLFRELVRAIQEERKKRKMNVWDKIILKIDESEVALNILERFGEKLMEEVGAESILVENLESGKEVEIESLKIKFDF